MANRGWVHGPTVKNGIVQYFSPSSLMTADAYSESGCLRKWWFEKIKGIKQPETDAQRFGTKLHASIEDYLKTGKVEELLPLARRGIPFFPEPGPDLGIELDIVGGKLSAAPLRVKGIPIAGYIDLVHRRGVFHDGEQSIIELPNTVTVLDWKTTSSPKYIKSPKEMSRTLQMTTYAKWAMAVYPETEHIRAGHGYFVTKGAAGAKMVSLRVHRDEVDKRWRHVEKVAGEVIDIAKETDQNKIPGNAQACDAFRGCFYRDICTYARHNSLSDLGFVGNVADTLQSQEDILADLGYTGQLNMAPEAPKKKDTGKVKMGSLLDNMKKKTGTGSTSAAKKPTAEEVAAEKARLAKEEVLLKYPDLEATLAGIEAGGLGMPTLTGEAARAASLLTGASLVDGVLPGTGDLAEESFDDPAVLAEVLEEVKQIVAARSAPTEAVSEETVADLLPEDAPPGDVVEVKPDPVEAAIEAAPTKKRGRKPKAAAVEAAPAETPAAPAQVAPAADTPATNTPPANNGPVFFYVDCVPSVPTQSFWPLVYQICGALAQKHGVDDIRSADKNSPLAFGSWKGFLAQSLKLAIDRVPPGHYTLDGASTEIGQIVAETMRELVPARGGLFVRGTR